MENSKAMALVNQTYNLLAKDDACTKEAERCKQLLEKLEKEKLTISIIGQFKRGKSTVSNQILGKEVLPSGIVPVTSVITKVVYGQDGATVKFKNGKLEDVPFDELSKYINEQENKGNHLQVDSVTVKTEAPFLEKGVEFVDTPGVGSFHKNNTQAAYSYLKDSDACIFLLSVDSPINQIEIDFLASSKEYAGKFYFAVNKIDMVSDEDLGQYMDYCQMLICQLMETDDIKMFPVSGKTGQGIDELTKLIEEDCREKIPQILDASALKKLRSIIKDACGQLDLYWKAMNLGPKDQDECFEKLAKYLEETRTSANSCNMFFEIKLNDIKLALSKTIEEIFGIDFKYEIGEISQGLMLMDKEQFLEEVDVLCKQLQETIEKMMLYREENAYTVVRRINAINRLGRDLRRILTKIE